MMHMSRASVLTCRYEGKEKDQVVCTAVDLVFFIMKLLEPVAE